MNTKYDLVLVQLLDNNKSSVIMKDVNNLNTIMNILYKNIYNSLKQHKKERNHTIYKYKKYGGYFILLDFYCIIEDDLKISMEEFLYKLLSILEAKSDINFQELSNFMKILDDFNLVLQENIINNNTLIKLELIDKSKNTNENKQ